MSSNTWALISVANRPAARMYGDKRSPPSGNMYIYISLGRMFASEDQGFNGHALKLQGPLQAGLGSKQAEAES